MLFDAMIVEDGAKSILNGPQDGLEMVEVARHKQNLNFPRCLRNSTMAQDGPKMGQNRPNMDPKWPRIDL